MKPELGGSQRKTSIRVTTFLMVHQQQEHHSPPPGVLAPSLLMLSPALRHGPPHHLNPPSKNTAPCSERLLPPRAVRGPLSATPCLCCRHGAAKQHWGKTELNWVWGRLPSTDQCGGRVFSAASPGERKKSVLGVPLQTAGSSASPPHGRLSHPSPG